MLFSAPALQGKARPRAQPAKDRAQAGKLTPHGQARKGLCTRCVDGTGETRTVEVFVRGDPRWDPRGEYKRFRAAFGDG